MTCQLHVAENSFTLTSYVSPFKANTSANWNAVSRQIWRGCHTFVNSGDFSQVPPKQSAVCSTCIIPVPPANCQFIWMASAFGTSATQPILGWLDHMLSYIDHFTKTAGKLKNRNNLMKLASSKWDTSANTLRSSALALYYSTAEYCAPVWSRSAHTSQFDVQLNSTMSLISGTLRSFQHWTASPTKEGCHWHWQAGEENHQTWQLANPAWYPQPIIATTDIQEAAVVGLATSWHQKSMEASLEVSSGGQFLPSVRPHNPANGFQPPSATVVSAEPFSHRTGTLWCLQKEMATYRHWSVSLWRDPDDVPHGRILSPGKTEWRLISATLCWWRRCFCSWPVITWHEYEKTDPRGG